jgi:hypothetical protein
LKDKDFAERGYFMGFELYNDVRIRAANAPAAEPGSVIAIEYEVRRRPWLDQFDFTLQESIPIRRSLIALQLPPGWELKTSWAGISPVSATQPSPNRWEWSLQDLAGIEHEPMRPPIRALSARLAIAYFAPGEANRQAGSWEALGRWYAQLTSGRRDPSPALTEKAHQLTAGLANFDSKARALAAFAQADVRYVAIEIGIGGYQPHPADDIFRARYGDCKDKATLLSTMLHEVGIASDYVLVDTYRGRVNPNVPSAAFNHAILAIQLPAEAQSTPYRSAITRKNGKRYLIFDPTDRYTPFGDLRGDLQDTYALLIAEDGGELIHTQLLPPDTNALVRTGHFVLGENGVLSGEMTEDRSGDHAARERSALLNANEQERTQLLERRLNHSLKGFSLESTSITQLDQLQRNLVIKYKLSSQGYSQTRGSLLLVRPRVLGEKSFALERKPRRYPFQFEDASRETDTYDIELPNGYVIDDVPDPVQLDVGFASYHSKVEIQGSILRYSRELVRQTDYLPADRAEDLRAFLGRIGADESSVVILRRTQ